MAIKIDEATWGGAAEQWKKDKDTYNHPEYEKILSSLKNDKIEIDNDIDKIDHQIEQLQAHRKKLQEEAQHTRELESAVKDIRILFDTDSFDELRDHLTLLKEAGVQNIEIGKNPENNFTIDEINSFIKSVVKEYSKTKNQELLVRSQLTEQVINKDLETRGITADKISSRSNQGFRQCLTKCVLAMLQQNLNQTGVVSRDSILGDEGEKIAKARKKIEDSK